MLRNFPCLLEITGKKVKTVSFGHDCLIQLSKAEKHKLFASTCSILQWATFSFLHHKILNMAWVARRWRSTKRCNKILSSPFLIISGATAAKCPSSKLNTSASFSCRSSSFVLSPASPKELSFWLTLVSRFLDLLLTLLLAFDLNGI